MVNINGSFQDYIDTDDQSPNFNYALHLYARIGVCFADLNILKSDEYMYNNSSVDFYLRETILGYARYRPEYSGLWNST